MKFIFLMKLETLQRFSRIQVKMSDFKSLKVPNAGFAEKGVYLSAWFYLRKVVLSLIGIYKSTESQHGCPDEFFL